MVLLARLAVGIAIVTTLVCGPSALASPCDDINRKIEDAKECVARKAEIADDQPYAALFTAAGLAFTLTLPFAYYFARRKPLRQTLIAQEAEAEELGEKPEPETTN